MWKISEDEQDRLNEGQNIVEGLKMRKHYVADYFV